MKLSIEFSIRLREGFDGADYKRYESEVGAALVTMTYAKPHDTSHFLVTTLGFFTALFDDKTDSWSVTQHNDVKTTFDCTFKQ